MKALSRVGAILLTLALSIGSSYAGIIAYGNDFDGSETFSSGVSGGFSGPFATVGVQGYSGLGTGANVFSGNFAINGSIGGKTSLTLSDLPTHSSIDINFLLAIIDSWDGDGAFSFQPDIFNVSVDGNSIFSHSFLNSEASPASQSYVPVPGVELANDVNLGFTHHSQFNTNVEHWRDDAYNMGLDPLFNNIAHSSSTLTIEWFGSGNGYQGGTDESFAIENVQIVLNGTASVPEPAALLLLTMGLLTFGASRRRRSN